MNRFSGVAADREGPGGLEEGSRFRDLSLCLRFFSGGGDEAAASEFPAEPAWEVTPSMGSEDCRAGADIERFCGVFAPAALITVLNRILGRNLVAL